MTQGSDTKRDPLAGNKELAELARLVASSIDAILKECGTKPFPSPNEPFTPQSEAIRMSPQIQNHIGIAVAASVQLISAIRPPPLSLSIHSVTFYIPACIRTVVELHVPEILRSAGPNGLHVNDIAAPTATDPAKLARVLRVLASSHIFREVALDTFAHNRVSSLLDTGKSIDDILRDPQSKHEKTMGIAAVIEHVCDEGFKSAGYLPETLASLKPSQHNQSFKTAFNIAHNTDLPLFDWFEQPENQYRRRRFANGMEGTQNLLSHQGAIRGFDWLSLPANSVIVDVGGGFGSQALAIAKAFDHLKFVIQDKQFVIQDAPKFWEAHYPAAIAANRVEFQVHDFFEVQPVRSPAVFFLRLILHDWSDEYCLKILRQLRAAAGPNTQLIVSDKLVAAACEEPSSIKDVPGGVLPPAPPPLLPNYGSAGILSYLADMHMLTLLNGSERTVASFKSLYEKSGWRLVRIASYGTERTSDTKIIGVPA